ncbi:MAG: hypothetical protein QNJ78_07595 [Gammaproteobacteria bacterium]|nr:hypothetical protein [Gammaproteobacteria bacterium]
MDASGESIAYAAYHDAWVSWSGQKVARVGDKTYISGYGSLPLTGSASVDILRSGDAIDILWDGNNLLSGIFAKPITDVEVVFGYYANLGWNGTYSFFGNESVDLVSLEGTIVPAPATIWLIAPFALAMLRRTNRRV